LNKGGISMRKGKMGKISGLALALVLVVGVLGGIGSIAGASSEKTSISITNSLPRSTTGDITITLEAGEYEIDQTGEYSAQDPDGGAIVSGETASGTIDPVGDTDAYTFYGEAGQGVVIEMAANGSDVGPAMYLYRPDGTLETQVVGGSDANRVAIREHQLEETGSYTIVSSASWAYMTSTTGEYSLSYVGVTVNNPPNTPSNPSPINHGTSVDIDADLSWIGGDPDLGDTVTYDVCVGSSWPPFAFIDTIGPYPATQSSITYDPGMLVAGQTYYWHIIARDNHGITREGPVWDFTVGQPGLTANWNLPWGLDADPASVNIWTYPGDCIAVILVDVEWSMPPGLLIWHYGGPGVGWRFYKKGWGAVNTLETLIPGKGYIGIVPTASVWEIPQG
jgi:hypothetical protein